MALLTQFVTCIHPHQSADNLQVFKCGCSCNVDVVLIIEVAKGGEGGGLEYGGGLLHSTHLYSEGEVSYRFIPGVGN